MALIVEDRSVPGGAREFDLLCDAGLLLLLLGPPLPKRKGMLDAVGEDENALAVAVAVAVDVGLLPTWVMLSTESDLGLW